MFWRPVMREQIGEYGLHVIMLQLTLHMDCQAFSRVLIYDGEHAEGAAVMGTVSDKIIRPDMAFVLRPQPYAGSVIEPKPTALRLLLRDF